MGDIVPGSLTGYLTSEGNELTGTLAGKLVRGFSAYEIAVLKGYKGTEEEWLASLKGDKGNPGEGVPTGGTSGQVLKKSSSADYDTEWADESGAVIDVQVKGTSVVTDGVAEIPIASTQNPGIVKVTSGIKGIVIIDDTLTIGSASSLVIKAGSSEYRPIVPARQHESTFYGLAKAAGHDEINSSLEMGTYTPEAKSAIQSMLGIDTAIANAVGQITSFEFQVVNELPATGTKGVIYLVAHSHGTSDIYDEYIWVTDKYERLGTLDVDLSNYVTFDDYATSSKAGVVKVDSGAQGLTLSNTGLLMIYGASLAGVKNGIGVYNPITPSHQHESTFYGLAKAAGDTTQSQSANAVGTYTDEAKAAIKAMLDITGECQTVTVTGTTPVITATQNTRYICGEVTSLDFTPSATGICDVIFTSGSTVTVLTLPSTVILPSWFDATALEANTTYEISISDGVYGAVMVW